MADTKTAKSATSRDTSSKGWTDEERAAMKEHAEELKKAKQRGGKAKKADGEADVQAKIAEMPDADRAMAERIHSIVKETAPDLAPRTWYGMPAYANEAGKVICFFTPASKFKERYASFGFNADANLDEGTMWPTAWALTRLSAADEKKIAELVKKAVS
jgi:uncharacterized protein YdhG (YjbR/CyaY superfamily)